MPMEALSPPIDVLGDEAPPTTRPALSEFGNGRLSPLISRERLSARVAEIGAQITRDYAGRRLVLLCVMKGSFMFAADLARAIDLPLRVDFLGVQSYLGGTRSTGVVQITQDLTQPIEGDDVLIVEDIVDSGLTVGYIMELLGTRRPNSLRLCALLHKPARQRQAIEIHYLGFTIEDVFVVGYGLDHAQRYRNLPEVAVLDPAE
jgi:hypoxanthine phosphoribosyltransferase